MNIKTLSSSAGWARPSLRALILTGSLLAVCGCASTKAGAKAETRAIEDIPTLEALPADARPVIKVSVRQEGEYEVPSQYRWILAFSGRDSGVASGDDIESKLTRALSGSNRFLVRANDFSDLDQEDELERQGRIRQDTAIEQGQIIAAQYAIRANVEDLNYAEQESGSGVGGYLPGWLPGRGYFNLGKDEKVATVRISAEIVNLQTGLIVQAVEGRGFQTSTSSKQAFTISGITLSQREKEDPTLANAITECIKELVYEIGRSIPANESGTGTAVATSSPKGAANAAGGFCTGCGEVRTSGASFCGNCGTAL